LPVGAVNRASREQKRVSEYSIEAMITTLTMVGIALLVSFGWVLLAPPF